MQPNASSATSRGAGGGSERLTGCLPLGCAGVFALVLVLFALGLGVLAYAAVEDNVWSAVAALGIASLVTGGVGMAPLWFVLRARRRAQGGEREVQMREPWRTREAWASDTLYVERPTKPAYLWAFEAVFFLIWHGVSWPVAIRATQQHGLGEPFVWATWLFPLVGVVLLIGVNYRWLRGLRRARYTFEMETRPGVIGGEVRGTVRAQWVGSRLKTVPVTVKLGCYERYVAYDNDRSERPKRAVRHRELWSDEQEVYAEERSGKGIAWDVAFEVPPDLEPSSIRETEERILWQLDVHRERAVSDLDISFELPVFEGQTRSTPPREAEAPTEPWPERETWEGQEATPRRPEPTTWRRDEEQQRGPRQDSAFGHEPWRRREAWQQHRSIAPEQKAGLGTIVGISTLILAICTFAALVPDNSGEAGGIGWFIAGLVIALGIVALGRNNIRQQRRLRGVTLCLDDEAGALGEAIAGTVTTSLRTSQTPPGGFLVRFGCYHRHLVADRSASSETSSKKVVYTPIWYAETRMQGQSSEDGKHVEVPFFFEVPPALPESTPEEEKDRIAWRVQLNPNEPVDAFRATFEVPVFVVPGRSHEEAPPNPYAGYVTERSFSETVSPYIRRTELPGGVRFDFGRGRNRRAARSGTAILVFVSLLLLSVTVPLFWYPSAFFEVLPFAAAFLALTVLVARQVWRYWMNTTTVAVEAGHITIRSGSLGRDDVQTMPCEDLVMVEVARRIDYAYDLNLIGDEPGEARREALRQRQAERAEADAEHVRTGGVADTKPERTGPLRTLLERRTALKDKVKAVEGIPDREEAAWVAARLEDVAWQQAGVAGA